MPWEVLLPLALIPGFWAGLCVVIAWMSGWSRLVQRFRADRLPFDGETFRFQFLRIGWCDYNGCVTYHVAPEGLFISIWLIFPGHPALLIPWNELRATSETKRRWFATTLFEVSSPSLCKMTVPQKVVDAARTYLRG